MSASTVWTGPSLIRTLHVAGCLVTQKTKPFVVVLVRSRPALGTPSDPMAWSHQQQRTLERDQATTSRRSDPPSTLEIKWTCPPKASDLYQRSSPDLEPTWEEKASPPMKHLAMWRLKQRGQATPWVILRGWSRIGMPGELLRAACPPPWVRDNNDDDDNPISGIRDNAYSSTDTIAS